MISAEIIEMLCRGTIEEIEILHPNIEVLRVESISLY